MNNPIDDKDSSDRVLRGGYWRYAPNYMRASSRFINYPTGRGSNIGFRIVRSK
jgi:formylglycine-generating enzyme required for sulfatase activity